MTVIIQEVYNAFKEAGISEESANYGEKFHELEREMDKRFNSVDNRFNKLEREREHCAYING